MFFIPGFQREFEWTKPEVEEFTKKILNKMGRKDLIGLLTLVNNVEKELVEEYQFKNERDVIDGQQRLIVLLVNQLLIK